MSSRKDCPDYNINNDKCCHGQVPCIGLDNCRKKYPALHKDLEWLNDDYRKEMRKFEHIPPLDAFGFPKKKKDEENSKDSKEPKKKATYCDVMKWIKEIVENTPEDHKNEL